MAGESSDPGSYTFGEAVCLGHAHFRPRRARDATAAVCPQTDVGRAPYEVSVSEPAPANDQQRRCSALRFQGRKRARSAGAAPPASAHAVRCAVNHARGFNCHRHNVCSNENSIAASWPDHTAPLP